MQRNIIRYDVNVVYCPFMLITVRIAYHLGEIPSGMIHLIQLVFAMTVFVGRVRFSSKSGARSSLETPM